MKRIVILTAVLGLSYPVAAQQIYWRELTQGGNGEASVRRASLDGANVQLVFNDGIQPLTHSFGSSIIFDSNSGKIYYLDGDPSHTSPDLPRRIMRSNLDGSNIEQIYITNDPEEARVLNSLEIVYPSSSAVPTISTWGFGIMLMLMIGIATLAFQRKQATLY